jgi:hypothetical protein
MAQSFIACDREQVFLMPPDVRDWLPEGHLAWFVIDAVERMSSAIEECRSVAIEKCRSAVASEAS